MTIPTPDLDDRRFEELLQELQLLIPTYTPELAIGGSDWTDWNDSDPGTTLLQLWAHVAETVLYRLNQVPDRAYVKFLDLVGLQLRPARPAVADVTFTAQPGFAPTGAAGVTVPERTQLGAQPADGGDQLVFESTEPVDLVRAELASIQVLDSGAFVDVTEQNAAASPPFRPLGWVPEPGNALYLGFEPPDPPIAGSPFPAAIRFRFFPPPAPTQAVTCVTSGVVPPTPAKLEWQYRRDADGQSWRPLEIYRDTTAGFTTGGYVIVQGPDTIDAVANVGRVEEPRFWLRCRMVEGAYPSGGPTIDFVAPNTVPAENLATVQDELLGESEGHPDQRFALRQAPMQPDTVELEVGVADGDRTEPWTRKDDLLASEPNDHHFTVDGVSGTVMFGDGRRGRIPPAGSPIIAREYRHGASEAGNVGPELIATLLTSVPGVDRVVNHRSATGGASAQTVDNLRRTAPARLRGLERAVTAGDYRSLALDVGTVARAEALPQAHPDHRNVDVPGSVMVVVIPESQDSARDPAPSPTAELLAEVCRHLDQNRTVATELHVVGPRYRRIKVVARVQVEPNVSFDTVRLVVAGSINAFLDPLGRLPGPLPGQEAALPASKADTADAEGWPFGQDLSPTSLAAAILDVDGVVAVPRLAVEVDGSPHDDDDEDIVLDADQLLYGADDHEIAVEPRTERTTRSVP